MKAFSSFFKQKKLKELTDTKLEARRKSFSYCGYFLYGASIFLAFGMLFTTASINSVILRALSGLIVSFIILLGAINWSFLIIAERAVKTEQRLREAIIQYDAQRQKQFEEAIAKLKTELALTNKQASP